MPVAASSHSIRFRGGGRSGRSPHRCGLGGPRATSVPLGLLSLQELSCASQLSGG